MLLPDPPILGGCQCGDCRFEITGRPLDLYVCHCTECRKQAASAFGISLQVWDSDFHLLRGAPHFWDRMADSGGVMRCFFCPNCGSRLYHKPMRRPGRIGVKGGTLDEPLDLTGAKHVWTRSKLKGVAIPPGAETFEKGQPN
jgi:hypothetical protein